MRYIGVAGSRRRDSQEDYNLLVQTLECILLPNDELVSGGCTQGADRFAELFAREHGIRITVLNADWNKYGKAAGPIRNKWIAEMVDVLIALPASDRTGGTESTIAEAIILKKKVILI